MKTLDLVDTYNKFFIQYKKIIFSMVDQILDYI